MKSQELHLVGLKQEIHGTVVTRLQEIVSGLEKDVRELQASANEETKSSAGDKYETGRAMIQLEIEKISQQLRQHSNSLAIVKGISIAKIYEHIQAGAVAETSSGNFILLVNGGEVTSAGKKFTAISLQSPLGRLLTGKSKGETIELNQRRIEIFDVY